MFSVGGGRRRAFQKKKFCACRGVIQNVVREENEMFACEFCKYGDYNIDPSCFSV
jgi:hypothetical protein